MAFNLSKYKDKIALLKTQIGEKRLKNAGIILMIALIMFLCTYAFQMFIGSMIYMPDKTTVTDWAFINGVNNQQITAQNAVFKQATKDNPVLVNTSKPYIHAYYTFDGSNKPRRLVINANYSPMKAEIDSKTVYNNGYGSEKVVGNSYNEIIIPASQSSQTVHIYMYTPFDFNFDAQVNNGQNMINFQMLFAFAIFSVGIVYSIAAICLRKGGFIKMILLGIQMLIGGFLTFLYSLSNSTDILNEPTWFNITIAVNMIVSLLSFLNIFAMINFNSAKIKILCVTIPVLAVVAVFVPFGIFLKLVMLLFAIVQTVLVFYIMVAMQDDENKHIKEIKLLQVATAYLFIINIFNSFAIIFGAVSTAKIVFVIGMVALNFILAIYYIKHIALKNLLNLRKQNEVDYLSDFYSEMSELITQLYSKTTNEQFISYFCKNVVPIIKKNNEVIFDDDVPVVYADAIKTDNGYNLIENTAQEIPKFDSLEESIGSSPCIIGNNYIGVRFKTDDSNAVIGYIGNIKIPFESAFKNYFSSLCSSAQAAFENHGLRFELFSVEEKMFINLSRIVEERSEETSSHLINVSIMTEILCKNMGYNDEESKLISTAAITHDIGKVAIPDAILNKKGIYTDEERETMKMHTVYGCNILRVSSGRFFDIAAKIAEQHHENYDGTGYMHKKGEEIDKYARIVRVVDTFDALVSKRCYKDAWDINDAVNYIIEGSGTSFDPKVVNAFKECKDEMIKARQ